ncbi:cytochrome Cy [Maritimibacter sp. 55A14]|uniref:c-type cytochrome n=1 Tax=Maritimibacter sp. 55A14 TaxID=2174844 RepID=UPI000D61358B|nr:cytochrome c family protein [Maritimibacter sp. 55A14]PWE32277.1 cytochrome Cy [Maritimibacter sp. 55A14]
MFDTMTMTKITGGFCGALLVFLLGNWLSETLYHTGGGHGGEEHAAYVIETGEDEGGTAEAEEGPEFAELLASADPADGEKAWGKCRACHSVEDGDNGTGPHLHNVVGRDIASVDGFDYSSALAGVEGNWAPEELAAWLEDPKAYAPGNKMGFAGLSKPKDQAAMVAFLIQNSPDYTPPEPAQEAAAEEPAAKETATDEPAAEEPAAEEPAAEETASEEPAEQEAAAAEDAAEEEPAAAGEASGFAAMVANGDPDAGKKVFRKCQACHVADKEQNRVGPHLVGVVGRDVASVEGFSYSDALSGVEGAWTPEKLSAWLENPREFASGNKMSFAGLSDEQDRADVIAYIESLSN